MLGRLLTLHILHLSQIAVVFALRADFIDSHLAEELLRRAEDVYLLDDLLTGSIRYIDHLKSSPVFHYVKEAVSDGLLVKELVDRCDVVYRPAAAVVATLVRGCRQRDGHRPTPREQG